MSQFVWYVSTNRRKASISSQDDILESEALDSTYVERLALELANEARYYIMVPEGTLPRLLVSRVQFPSQGKRQDYMELARAEMENIFSERIAAVLRSRIQKGASTAIRTDRMIWSNWENSERYTVPYEVLTVKDKVGTI